MKKLLILFLFPISFLFADSVTLYNDSAFELTAIVQAATGKILAQKTFHPGEQSTWDSDQTSTQLETDYDSSGSYTPYTVIWRCSYEGYFSVCSNIASGAMVTANSCPGSKFCKPKPKKEDDKNQKQSGKTACRSCKGNEEVFQ